MTGQRFGRWTVLERAPSSDRFAYWLCRCDCGNIRVVRGVRIRLGRSRSCGCLAADKSRDRAIVHGHSKSRAYASWRNMIARCEDPNHNSYADYGGRGIEICDNWKSFEKFYADMGDPPEGKTLERIDNNGSYCPENCTWASKKQQARNKRSNRMITLDNETRCLAEWCDLYGIDPDLVWGRLRRGWDAKKALTLPKLNIHD